MSSSRKMVDSEIESVKLIPEKWEAKPLCQIATCNDDSIKKNTPFDKVIRYVDISSVSYSYGIKGAEEVAFADAPSRARRLAKLGDVVVSTVRTYLCAVAAVGDEHADCVFSTGFAVLRPILGEVSPPFLKWAILGDSFIQSVEENSKGVSYPAINSTEMMKLKIIVPPTNEQTAISEYLDHHTSLIDQERALISQKIDLLRDKRKALIFEVVTGKRTIVEAQALAGDGGDRLNDVVFSGQWAAVPTAKMDDPFARSGRLVDSGVEWIGDVPEGWVVTRFSDVSSHANGDWGDEPTALNEGIVCYRKADYTGTAIHFGATRRITHRKPFVQYLDTIVEKSGGGDKSPVGAPALVVSHDKAICSNFMMRLRAKQSVMKKLLFYTTLSLYQSGEIYNLFKQTTGIQNLDTSKFMASVFPLSDANTQEAIVEFLDATTDSIDMEISLLQRKMDLLADKRKALIFEAVTGKIDLRDTTIKTA